jgi:hypothetical protein
MEPFKDDPQYWAKVRRKAEQLNSDGCSWTVEWHQECCFEHDIAYKTGRTVLGATISRAEADAQFRRCIQSRSRLGRWSPLSWVRWGAVRLFGGKAYKDPTKRG